MSSVTLVAPDGVTTRSVSTYAELEHYLQARGYVPQSGTVSQAFASVTGIDPSTPPVLPTPGSELANDPALRAAFVPKWKPATAYASGEFVLNPSGQIVSANTAFTSGTTYSAGNWTIVSGGTGDVAFDDLGETAFDITRLRATHALPLTTPTYDGSGQAVHPDVWVFREPFGGYRYWMTLSPYPGGDDTVENPSILAANDPAGPWVVPAGLTNPIDAPTSGGFYPDGCLVTTDNDTTLWCVYAINHAKSTTDGVHWSAAQTLTLGGTANGRVSQAVAEHKGTFYHWCVDTTPSPNTMELRTGSTVLSYGNPTICTLNGGPTDPTRELWHMAVRKVLGGFVGTLTYCDKDTSGVNAATYLGFTHDGLTWTVGAAPLLAPDPSSAAFNQGVYRSCFVPTDGRGGIVGHFWYSGVSNSTQWHVAYTPVQATVPVSLPELARVDQPNIMVAHQAVKGDGRNLALNPTMLRPNGTTPLNWSNNMAGGTNFGWDPATDSWTATNSSTSDRNITQQRTDLTLNVGDWWCFSFEGKAATTGLFRPTITFRDSGGTQLTTVTPSSVHSADFKRVSVSAQVPAGAARIDLLIIAKGATATAEQYWFRRTQLEKAQLPTPWSPGPVSTVRLPASPIHAAFEVTGALTTAGSPVLSSFTKEGALLLPSFTTAGRPAASAVAKGTVIFDSTLNLPVSSDGASWTQLGGSTGSSTIPHALTTGEAIISREVPLADSGTISASGILTLRYFTAAKSETITQVKVVSGSTAAAATPTLVRIGIYSVAADGSLTLVGSTPNDTTVFAAALTAYTRTLDTPFVKTAGQRYAVGPLVVTAAALPSLLGVGVVASSTVDVLLGGAPRVTGQVTGQTDLPSTVTPGSINSTRRNGYAELLP